MREYIEQFYNEGLATTFYLKPINWINMKIKNKLVLKIISILIKILYTFGVIIFALFVFYLKWPL